MAIELRKERKMRITVEDISCAEDFVNVYMNNKYGFTTEQIENRQIKTESGRVIGKLLSADEDLIYGIVYDISSLYDDTKKSFDLTVG